MSDHQKDSIKVVISGQTPSQKNNKQIYTNFATGKPFISSSDIVKKWQEAAYRELQGFPYKCKGRVQIDYMFYVVDDTQRDLDNMMASVNDVLQKANAQYGIGKNRKPKMKKGTGIIQGDHWQMLRIGSADAAIDRENPRAEMVITIIDNMPQ